MKAEPLEILYLDDSQTALSSVRDALQAVGHTVHCAESVIEAQMFAPRCDVVLIDYHMPAMSGADALRQLTKRSFVKTPMFYLYTTDVSIASRFRELGFDGAFTQKGNSEALVTQINAAARIRKMRQFVRGRHR